MGPGSPALDSDMESVVIWEFFGDAGGSAAADDCGIAGAAGAVCAAADGCWRWSTTGGHQSAKGDVAGIVDGTIAPSEEDVVGTETGLGNDGVVGHILFVISSLAV